MYFLKALKLSLVVSSIFSLISCANIRNAPPAEQIKSRGLVIATVVTNSTSITTLHNKLTSITIEASQSGDDYSMYPSNKQYGSTQVFTAWVPAGKYKITEMLADSAAGNGGATDTDNILDEFEVVRGKITDLQTIVYQPTGNLKITLIPIDKGVNISKYVKKHYPSVSGKLLRSKPVTAQFNSKFPLQTAEIRNSSTQGLIVSLLINMSEEASKMKEQLHWPKAKSTKELIKMAKNSTLAINGGYFAEGGVSYFGSKLGQILLRNKNGQWSSLDTGYIEEILSVHKYENKLFAGFEDGKILISNNKGQTWKLLNTRNRPNSIIHISAINANQLLIADRRLADPGSIIKVYTLDISKNAKLTLIKTIKQDMDSGWTSGYIPRNILVRTPNKLFISKDTNHIEKFNIPAKKWTTIKTPDVYQLLKSNNRGDLILLINNIGFSKQHFLSLDEGKSWQKVDAPNMAINLHFRDKKHGYGLKLNMGMFSSTMGIIKTGDSGKNWNESTEMENYCVDFIVIDENHDVICASRSGELMSTKNGNNWIIERAVN